MLRTLALALLATTVACGSTGGGSAAKPSTSTSSVGSAATVQLTSPAFKDGGPIPAQYTCDGSGQSPPLAWSGVPTGTASVALRVQDIDTAQKFIHWIVYDIPPSTTALAGGQIPPGARQTTNSFGKQGYGGMCPPAGARHRYVFTVLALQTELTVSDQGSPSELWSTLERSAVVGKGELTGTYQRGGS